MLILRLDTETSTENIIAKFTLWLILTCVKFITFLDRVEVLPLVSCNVPRYSAALFGQLPIDVSQLRVLLHFR